MEIPYIVEHRNVKYPRLEFKGLQLLVILPQQIKEPSEIIEKRRNWIERKWSIVQEAVKQAGSPEGFLIFGESYKIENAPNEKPAIDHAQKKIRLNPENPQHRKIIQEQLKKLLKQKIQPIIEEYAERFGFHPKKVIVKKQKTKWGSCSNKGNITLNLKLICLPEQMIRYIVYHELVHLKIKRHNLAFWEKIYQEFKDYKHNEKKLLEYWFSTELLFQNLTKNNKA